MGINLSNACDCIGIEHSVLCGLPDIFEVRLEDIHIWHLLPGSPQTPRFDCDFKSYIQMIFSLDSLSQAFAGPNEEQLGPEEHNLLFIPEGCQSLSALNLDSQREIFGINISLAMFFKFLPEHSPVLKNLTHKRIKQKSPFPITENRPVTTAMREVINQILRCLRRDHCRCIYYQAKVMELLSLQMEQIERVAEHSRGLKEEEIRRVYRVRDILEQSPEQSFSLLGLAHAVGTNDATLKKHFKMVFGVTVFTYLNSFRMERAKEMLLRREYKIASIANQFGYKHATHFSAAFKKYFGYPPTKMKE